MCFVYTREAFVYKIHKLRNSIHEVVNGFSCRILWRNSLAPAKLPHGTNGSNGLKRTLTTACSGRRRAPPLMLSVNATALRTAFMVVPPWRRTSALGRMPTVVKMVIYRPFWTK
jgi:hypothetical protein